MKELLFDIETDGLLEEATRVHCVVALDVNTGEEYVFGPSDVEAGVILLSSADTLIGHGIAEFDVPVLKRLFPHHPLTENIIDTVSVAMQVYAGPSLAMRDAALSRSGKMPRELIGLPRLEAWGYRLGLHKGTYTLGWDKYTPEMLEYCRQDVRVNKALWDHLCKRADRKVMEIESRVQAVLARQQQHGVRFDEPRAAGLAATLSDRREQLRSSLSKKVPSWWAPNGKPVTPKKDAVSRSLKPGDAGYRNVAAGCPYQKIKLVEFNPASNQHISRTLMRQYGWRPGSFTDGGDPKVEEKILADLDYPICEELVEYQQIKKILGFISEGDNAWLKLVRNGRLHGKVWATGTVTNRMSHSKPNLGQVPKVGKLYGRECRELFLPDDGCLLIGCDAQGLQLRMLAHYAARHDGGAFARVCESGDPHTYLQAASGIQIRDNQKTLGYAWLFGAGDMKLGTVVITDRRQAGLPVPPLSAARRLGKEARAGLTSKLKMGAMDRALKQAAARGWLRGLDGRRIAVLSQHRALNALLMSAEAVVMKHALLRAAALLRQHVPEARLVLNVHDEWQATAPPADAQRTGEIMKAAIIETGKALGLRCRLDAEYKIGNNWSETH